MGHHLTTCTFCGVGCGIEVATHADRRIRLEHGAIAEDVRPGIPLTEKLGRIFTGLATEVAQQIDVEVRGEITEFDVKVLVKEFNQIASPEESGLLLDCLFLVAAADGKVHPIEHGYLGDELYQGSQRDEAPDVRVAMADGYRAANVSGSGSPGPWW